MQPCLELIDGKGGLFSCLDDIQRFEGKEANLKFLSSFKQKHGPPAGGGGGLRYDMYHVEYLYTSETVG